MKDQKSRRNSGIHSQRRQAAFAVRDAVMYEGPPRSARPRKATPGSIGYLTIKRFVTDISLGGEPIRLNLGHPLQQAVLRINHRDPAHRLAVSILSPRLGRIANERFSGSEDELKNRLESIVSSLPHSSQTSGRLGAADVFGPKYTHGVNQVGMYLERPFIPGLEVEAKRILRRGFDCGLPVEMPYLPIAQVDGLEAAQKMMYLLNDPALDGLQITLGAPEVQPI